MDDLGMNNKTWFYLKKKKKNYSQLREGFEFLFHVIQVKKKFWFVLTKVSQCKEIFVRLLKSIIIIIIIIIIIVIIRSLKKNKLLWLWFEIEIVS